MTDTGELYLVEGELGLPQGAESDFMGTNQGKATGVAGAHRGHRSSWGWEVLESVKAPLHSTHIAILAEQINLHVMLWWNLCEIT